MYIKLDDVEQYVTYLLKHNLPETLKFHNFTHTKDVVNAVLKIGQNSGLSHEELEIITIAAWFHDTGHTVIYDGHEEESKKIAQKHLSILKYEERKIQKVNDCIQATKLPQNPKDKLEEVICDADLYHLSQQNYFIKSELLRKEWELILHKFYSDMEWYELNITFFKKHCYLSSYGKKTLENQKKANRRRLLQLYRIQEQRMVSKFHHNNSPFSIQSYGAGRFDL